MKTFTFILSCLALVATIQAGLGKSFNDYAAKIRDKRSPTAPPLQASSYINEDSLSSTTTDMRTTTTTTTTQAPTTETTTTKKSVDSSEESGESCGCKRRRKKCCSCSCDCGCGRSNCGGGCRRH